MHSRRWTRRPEAEVFDGTGQDFRAALDIFRQAAAAKNPKTFLRDWAADHAGK